VFDQPYPLLGDDLPGIKAPTAGPCPTRPNNSPPQAESSKHAGRDGTGDDDSLIDAFGMVYRVCISHT
jgi:hypothetical protein